MSQRTPLPFFRSTPVAAAWAFTAGVLMVVITLRIIDHGLAFGRWLATHAM